MTVPATRDQLETDFVNSETKRIRNANIFGGLAALVSTVVLGWIFITLL
jgi:hypothetical protein